MTDTRRCPYCAEEIAADAVRCRWCRSRVAILDPDRWCRDLPERRAAGVAAALSRVLVLPLPAVRLGFVALTFVHLLGPLLYVALWLITPFRPGIDAPLARLLGSLQDVVRGFFGTRPRRPDGGPVTGDSVP